MRKTSVLSADLTRQLAFFAKHESEVRYYCRRVPSVLCTAKGAIITDSAGREYVDMMSSCGSLNFGHNHPYLKEAAADYILRDGVCAALDFHTEAKLRFMEAFHRNILQPRNLAYKMQFPGPTGTNCVEAAIKLARKSTGRSNIVAFTNAFHGVSSGALSATASQFARRSAGSLLNGVLRLPYDSYHGAGIADLKRLEAMARDPSGGVDGIAAVLVEVVQGEGGLNVASKEWLSELAKCTKSLNALLIVDEIQTGCGRTGSYFAFERADIIPDLVCLSKSISGYGFPMSLLLMRPELDVWSPGEHNGTFRGNSLAFVTAAAAIDLWTDEFAAGIKVRSDIVLAWCNSMIAEFPSLLEPRGIGMMQGLWFSDMAIASEVADEAARCGIIIECCGPHDEVLKFMPPLNIEVNLLRRTLGSLGEILRAALIRKSIPTLQSDEAVLDPHNDGSDPIACPKLSHRIANVEFDGFLRDR